MTDSEKVEILKQYERMIFARINKINRHKFLSREAEEELANDMRMKIWTSLDSYDPAKAGLSTWIYQALSLKGSTFLYHYFKDTVKTVDNSSVTFTEMTPEDSKEGFSPVSNDSLDGLSFNMMLDCIPDKKDRYIMYRWCCGWTMRDIAGEDGCSMQNVQQKVKRIVKWLRENMDKTA